MPLIQTLLSLTLALRSHCLEVRNKAIRRQIKQTKTKMLIRAKDKKGVNRMLKTRMIDSRINKSYPSPLNFFNRTIKILIKKLKSLGK